MKQMNDDRFNSLDPSLKEYILEEEKLAAHDDDPLDTPLTVKIQRLTMERLQEYCRIEECNIDEAVNDFIKSVLYDAGL